MAEINFHYDPPAGLSIHVVTDEDGETIVSLDEFRQAFELLVHQTSTDIPLEEIERVVKEVLADQPL